MSIPGVQLGVPQGVPGGAGAGAGGPGLNAGALQAAMEQMKPIAVGLANYLRDNPQLKARKGLLDNTEDVDFFRYKRLVRALTSEDYKQKQQDPKNRLIPIKDAKQAQEVSKLLVQMKFIIPSTKLHYKEIKQTNKKWVPKRDKPTLVKSKTLDLSPDAYYVWSYYKPSPYTALYGAFLLIGIFVVILFPLWPRKMKTGVYYLSMSLLGLLGLLFVIAIFRLILYILTLVIGKPFWLFPNLFADVGVIESFFPLYEWEKPKKSKKAKGVVKKSTIELKEVE